MAQDIIITPGDGDIVFHNAAGTEAGKIYLNGDDLVITNAVGNVLFGDTSSDVYIGDGVNSVDIVFEQNGEIRAETGVDVTLTIGSSSTTLKFAGLSNQSSEATSLMIDANNVVGYRELGSAAFSATTDFAASSHTHDSRYYTETEIDTLLAGYASTDTATTSKNGLMSSTDKSKLDGIASGAEVNVQADWNQSLDTADDFIKNKPGLSFLPLSGGTVTGVVTLTGSSGVSRLRIEGTTPTIDLDDSDGDSFYIHVNSNNFYVLADRDGAGNYNTWESPHPLQLEADTNKAFIFGSEVKSAAFTLSTDYAAASHNHDSRYYTETEVDTLLGGYASTDVATSSKNGLMSSTDKSKLDGIDDNANNYVLPTNIITAGTYGSTSNATKIDSITVDSSGRVTAIATGAVGDIQGVTAGTNLSGGGNSGTVTLNLNEFLDNTFAYQNTTTGVFMPMVKGGLFTTQTSSVTGALRIDLPSYRTDMMLSFTVDIYEYDTDRSATYRVGGYNYSDANATWYNTFAYCLQDSDNRDLTVYFMSDTTNGKQYVKIGSTSTTWSYPQVVVRDVLGGYSTSTSDFVGTWEVSFVTETPGTATSTHTNNQVYASWDRISGIPSTFSPSAHTHDDRYYTETETDTLLSGKSDTSHNHDGRYYTETEIDTLLGGYASTDTATTSKNGLMSSTDKSKLDGVAANANNYSLPVASTSLGGVKSGTDITVDASGNVSVNNDSHTHDSRYYTETEVSATLGNGIAGWTAGYGSGTYTNISWSVANDAVEIQSSSDTSIGGVFKAIRVKSGDVVRFSVMLKGSAAASSGLYLRLYQYNGDLPDGKTHVSNDAQGSLVQEDSAGDTGWYENGAITTSWTNFERDYTAAADGYVSLVVLNWTGIGNNSVFVKTPDIQKVKMASAGTADSANAVTWDNVSSKPTSFTPSSHNHDDRYYTETESDTLFATAAQGAKADSALQSIPSAISVTSVAVGSTVTLTESTDRADLLYINSSTSSWGGLQVGNTSNEFIFSLMGNGNAGGIYDDQNGDWLIYWDENAGVYLYYNAAQKLATTSTGISVSGEIVTTGGNSTNWQTAYGWGNHASAGYLTSLPDHTHDYLPLSGGTMTGAFSLKSDAWHTSTDSKNRLYFGNNARTYFGSANGYEWRSSSDGALAVILNTGELGIGTTSPAYKIDVSGGAIAIRGNAAGNSLRFNDTGGTSRNAIYVDTSNYLNVGNANYTGLKLYHSTTTAPSTNALDGGGISQGFGNTDNGTVLAEPSAWLEVRVGTTDYVIPMYVNG